MKTLLFFTLLATTSAQTAPNQPTFEAISIKPAQPATRGGGYNIFPGRLNAKNQTLRDLVKFAYSLQDYQLTGGDDNERYELIATYPGETTDAQRRLMLQSVLTERFALTLHHEQKDISGYELISGKKGPKLQKAESSQPGMMLGQSAATGQRTLRATSATMPGFASLLASILRAPVEDRTELSGTFDFNLEWTPDVTQVNTQVPLNKQGTPAHEPSAEGPSLFTALQNTLGLALKSHMVTVEILVIDHAERPSAN
jgi:uncharacterized protein (TIGR03435 family)